VVRHAPCPVLIARAGAHAGPILVATDFSDPAFPALVTGAAEARRATSGMVAIHVVDGLRALVVMATPIPLDLTAHEAVRQRALADGARELEEVMARLEIQGEALIDEGLPAERVVAAARRLDARQIVVGSVGRDGLGRLLLGSVAEEIAHTAPCSVLAVRLHRRRAASAS
ncbi:MAG: universal stress protein, partial [Myxococcales bacterium]|nr:universal stress protein [Myxococcales bacterium]